MSKRSTQHLVDAIVEIGENIGFISKTEVSLSNLDPINRYDYDPRFDVLWFLDISDYNPAGLQSVFPHAPSIPTEIPVMAFEVEGSTTSSKNQAGNLFNLTMCPSLFKYMIVDNQGAKNEQDTYRRGIKICRTLGDSFPARSFIFSDKRHLINLSSIDYSTEDNPIIQRVGGKRHAGRGGEQMDTLLYLSGILSDIEENTIFSVFQDYSPPQFEWMYASIKQLQDLASENETLSMALGFDFFWIPKQDKRSITKMQDYYYIPKIDMAIEVPLPLGFTKFLHDLSMQHSHDRIQYSILEYAYQNKNSVIKYPLLGIEHENSKNKHMNGGIANISKFFYKGILIADAPASGHLSTMKTAGIRNVSHHIQ